MLYLLLMFSIQLLSHLVLGIMVQRNNLDLTEVPDDIPLNTTTLILDGNLLEDVNTTALQGRPIQLLSLRRNRFREFPNLLILNETLDILLLRNNLIRSIPKSVLDGFQCLTQLALDYNNMVEFPDLGPIGGTLHILTVSYNQLHYLNPLYLANLTVLNNLRLNNNNFRKLPNVTDIADTIINLYISGNPLDDKNEMPTWLLSMQFSNIHDADFAYLSLTSFPALGPSCASLRAYFLSHNSITEVKAEDVEHCSSLSTFKMSNNQLTSFPNISSVGPTLKELTLANNHLPLVPPEILHSLVALETIDLTGNMLVTVPDFATSNVLRELRLSDNAISYIAPNSLKYLQSLKILQLSNNILIDMPNVLMAELTDLDLSSNSFLDIPPLTKLGQNLINLNLADNIGITSFQNTDLSNLQALKRLRLEGTSITTLSQFTNLAQLQYLFLSTMSSPTPIESISPFAMSSFGNLTELHLENTLIKHLPSICDETPPNMYLAGNLHLDICNPDMAWLKHPGFTVHVTAKECPNGEMWHDASFTDLLNSLPLELQKTGTVHGKFLFIYIFSLSG